MIVENGKRKLKSLFLKTRWHGIVLINLYRSRADYLFSDLWKIDEASLSLLDSQKTGILKSWIKDADEEDNW